MKRAITRSNQRAANKTSEARDLVIGLEVSRLDIELFSARENARKGPSLKRLSPRPPTRRRDRCGLGGVVPLTAPLVRAARRSRGARRAKRPCRQTRGCHAGLRELRRPRLARDSRCRDSILMAATSMKIFRKSAAARRECVPLSLMQSSTSVRLHSCRTRLHREDDESGPDRNVRIA